MTPRWSSAARLTGDDPAARAAAQDIAARLGRNLGWLLITLRRGDEVNRLVRPDWQAADWEKWAAIRTDLAGRRAVQRRAGSRPLRPARAACCATWDTTTSTCACRPTAALSRWLAQPARCPLLPDEPAQRTVLGFDFGHTLVKRAVLQLRGRRAG